MKILYIANARIPTEKAHGFQICKMCEQLSLQGAEVELIVSKRNNTIIQDVFQYYDLKKVFTVRLLKVFDVIQYNKLFFKKAMWLQRMIFLIRLLFVKLPSDAIVFTRDSEISWLMSRKGYQVFFEAHSWPSSQYLYNKFLQNSQGIICNSIGTLTKHSKEGFGDLLLAPNGVDLDSFDYISQSKYDIREKLGLSGDKKILMYLGHLYPWKGVDVIIELAEKMKNYTNFVFIIIGGTDKDVVRYSNICKERELDNVIILDRIIKKDVPLYLKSADLLFLPNMPISDESMYYTSPIKMFEYMASRVPILASDLPSIKEVLNLDNAYLARAGDVSDFESVLINIFKDYNTALKKSEQAYREVQNFTWQKRTEKIINFIKLYNKDLF